MSLKALEAIAQAEETARRIRTEAQTEAGKAIEAAGIAAAQRVADAETQAAEELRELMRKTEEEAKGEAEKLAAGTRSRQSVLEVRAEGKMDAVAAGIVERIVSG